MGQKTNPIGLRLGIIKSWESKWYSEKDYSKLLQEDINLRKFLLKILSQDFNFNKLQIIYNKSIFNISLNIKKSKKKNWYK